MIGQTLGHLGSGKTLLLTYFALLTNKNIPIYANFHIKLPNVKVIEPNELEDLEKGILLIDEAYLWLDSRCSGREINRYLSYLIFQSRKRGFNVFASSQLSSAIDLRYRFISDLNIYAVGETGDTKFNAFRYIFNGWGASKTVFLPFDYAKKFLFNIYDTLEYPEMELTTFEPKRFNQTVEEVVKKLKEEYDIINKFSKGMIGDVLLEEGMFNERLVNSVYDRLKRQALMEKAKE